MLHRGGDGPDGAGFGGSALVPSCTECDAGANFVLVTRNESTPIGRCECADTFGTVVTANATVTINNETRTVPVFSCGKCDAGQVPLGPKSNLRYTYNGTLVLINTTAASAAVNSNSAAVPKFTSLPTAPNATATARRNRTHRARRAGAKSANIASVSLSSLAVPSAAIDVPVPFLAAAAAAAAEPSAGAASSIGDGAVAAHRGGGGDREGGAGGPVGAPRDGEFEPRGPGGDGHGDFGGHGGEHGGEHGGHGQCVACPTGSATTDGISCVAMA
ncbi:hypothetical protein OEZ86_011093 [Tetradesmus obliquus]|nr:hypothetical protein OEZ86_011093 [Tetradesmus obliquus]